MARTLKACQNNLKIRHLKTSAFHPRINGETERYNGLLGDILTKLVGNDKHKLDEFLPQALWVGM